MLSAVFSSTLDSTVGPLQFPWVIYALGQDKNALIRACAIAHLAATQRQVFLVTNSEEAAAIQLHLDSQSQSQGQSQNQFQSTRDNLSIQQVPPDATEEAVLAQINQLFSVAPFVLIVDAVPTGVYGELTSILPALANIPKILVLREIGRAHV